MFDKEHPDFKLLVTCDNYFRELRADGVGAESQPTEPFTVEDDEKLWNYTAVLSTHTPDTTAATFSGANISGCTINVFQAPTIKHFQVGGESDLTKLEVQELFSKF